MLIVDYYFFIENDLIKVLTAVNDITDWSFLGLLLGLKEAQLKRITIDERTSSEREKEIVQEWFQTDKASWAMLASALKHERIQRYDIAAQITKEHPS